MVLFNTTLNACVNADRPIGNFVVQKLLEFYKMHNIVLRCPLPKGDYSYKDIPVININWPLMVMSSKFRFGYKMRALVAGSKKFVDAYSSQVIGEFIKE